MLPHVLAPSAPFTLFAYLVCLLAITSSTLATPLLKHAIEDLTQEATSQLKERQSSGAYTAVTGVTGFGTPPRLEIRQLQQNTDQWNLFMLGLNKFMKTDQSDKLSYYRICGKTMHQSNH